MAIYPDFSDVWSVATRAQARLHKKIKLAGEMELFIILLFSAHLLSLTRAEDNQWDDILRPTTNPRPVGVFALDNSVGPLPNFVQLNLHLKYDLTLLAQFGGRKAEAEAYVERVVLLATPFLRHPNLVVKIHIKVCTTSIILIGKGHNSKE